MIERVCKGCGGPLPAERGPGQRRIWCSEKCRKRQYHGICENCGAETEGRASGVVRGVVRFCHRCAGEGYKFWTQDTIIEAMQEYERRYGRPPTAADWNRGDARRRLHPDRLAQVERRWEEGLWPHATSVLYAFGSWNAAIRAAGFVALPTGWKRAERVRAA